MDTIILFTHHLEPAEQSNRTEDGSLLMVWYFS